MQLKLLLRVAFCLHFNLSLVTLAASVAARPKSSFLARGGDENTTLRFVASAEEIDREDEIHDELKDTAAMPGQSVMTAAAYRRSLAGPSPAPAPGPSLPGFLKPPPGVEPPAFSTPKSYPHAFVEMESSDPHLVEASRSDAPGAAITIASGLGVTADVPLTRFVVLLPDSARPGEPNAVVRCESSMSQNMQRSLVGRYATKDNSSFICTATIRRLNMTDQTFAGALLLQKQTQRHGQALAVAARSRVELEVGILPATGIDGDIESAETVADDIIGAAQGSEEPRRVLQDDGTWTYKASPSLKWRALFPEARAALAGQAFQPFQDTSINLGPDPSVLGVKDALGNVPNATEEEQLHEAEEAFEKAGKINAIVENSVQEMHNNLARASKAHMEVLTNSSFVPYDPYEVDIDMDYLDSLPH